MRADPRWSSSPRTSTGPRCSARGGNMHKTLRSVAVRAPGFGFRRVAELEDMAVALGGHVIAKDTGIELSEVSREHLRLLRPHHGHRARDDDRRSARRAGAGRCSRRTTRGAARTRPDRRGPGQPRVAHRPADRPGRGDPRRRRHQRGTQGTDAARRGRVGRDAGRMEAGIVSGGGTALAQAHRALADLDLPGDEGIGTQVVRRALAEPLRWIAHQRRFRRRRSRRRGSSKTSRSGTDSTPSPASTATCSTRGSSTRSRSPARRWRARRRSPRCSSRPRRDRRASGGQSGRHHRTRFRRPGRGHGPAVQHLLSACRFGPFGPRYGLGHGLTVAASFSNYGAGSQS